MVYTTIKGGNNSVKVCGDDEKITVVMKRSSIAQYRKVIHYHPGIIESIVIGLIDDDWVDHGFTGHLTAKLVFEMRIKAAIKKATEIAEAYDRSDAEFEANLVREKKTKEQKNQEINEFVEGLKKV
jgi:hypothetical protein